MVRRWHDELEIITPLLAGKRAACGTTKVVAVDGPSGAGKTSLTEALAAATGASVLHLDDVYPGWHGLAATPAMVAGGVLERIAAGTVGLAPRWSWVRDAPVEPGREVPPAPLLILDGVGSGAAEIRPFLSLLVWVDAPVDVRRRRALERDRETFAPFWDVWAAQERQHFASDGTRAHADLVVDTSTHAS